MHARGRPRGRATYLPTSQFREQLRCCLAFPGSMLGQHRQASCTFKRDPDLPSLAYGDPAERASFELDRLLLDEEEEELQRLVERELTELFERQPQPA